MWEHWYILVKQTLPVWATNAAEFLCVPRWNHNNHSWLKISTTGVICVVIFTRFVNKMLTRARVFY